MVQCIRIGLSIEEFWSLDFTEIQAYFDAYKINKEQQMKEQAASNWKMAMLIAADVGSVFGSKKPPTLYESYPELFKQEAEEEKWKAYQAQMLQYAELWNLKRQTGGPEDVQSSS